MANCIVREMIFIDINSAFIFSSFSVLVYSVGKQVSVSLDKGKHKLYTWTTLLRFALFSLVEIHWIWYVQSLQVLSV